MNDKTLFNVVVYYFDPCQVKSSSRCYASGGGGKGGGYGLVEIFFGTDFGSFNIPLRRSFFVFVLIKC